MARKSPARIYQLKVTLAGTKPPVWRRLVVPGDIRLHELHDVLQNAMGWTDSHLHQFIVKSDQPKLTRAQVDEMYRRGKWPSPAEVSGLRYLSDPAFGMEEVEDETKVRLDALAPGPRAKFVYEYDMGDSWQHQILVEKILDPDPGTTCSPHCVDGALACPPEDCGGVWGYYDLLDAVADPKHPGHEDRLEWLGGDFDPEHFRADEVNRYLAKLKPRGGRRRR
jgi:hypothetical protein